MDGVGGCHLTSSPLGHQLSFGGPGVLPTTQRLPGEAGSYKVMLGYVPGGFLFWKQLPLPLLNVSDNQIGTK